MKFPFYMDVSWGLVCITFGATILVGFIMHLLSKKFYTLYVFVRKFSILDLEFPVSALELATYIKGIFLLPKELSEKSLHALKNRLYINFLSIFLKYATIFLLCMKLSYKMSFLGNYIFIILALLQIIPLLGDLVENFYLLQKLSPNATVSTDTVHRNYQLLAKIKWTVFLTAVVFCITTLVYFWLIGNFSYHSMVYLIIIIAELVLIFILMKTTANSSKIDLDQYQNIGN